jgi:hypothetical protein
LISISAVGDLDERGGGSPTERVHEHDLRSTDDQDGFGQFVCVVDGEQHECLDLLGHGAIPASRLSVHMRFAPVLGGRFPVVRRILAVLRSEPSTTPQIRLIRECLVACASMVIACIRDSVTLIRSCVPLIGLVIAGACEPQPCLIGEQ